MWWIFGDDEEEVTPEEPVAAKQTLQEEDEFECDYETGWCCSEDLCFDYFSTIYCTLADNVCCDWETMYCCDENEFCWNGAES